MCQPCHAGSGILQFCTDTDGQRVHRNSAATDGNGRLFFGSRQGILAITPHKDPTRQTSARCALTDIRINGVSALTMDGNDRPLTSALTRTRHISLGHTENSLTLLFSDFEYSKPHSTLTNTCSKASTPTGTNRQA